MSFKLKNSQTSLRHAVEKIVLNTLMGRQTSGDDEIHMRTSDSIRVRGTAKHSKTQPSKRPPFNKTHNKTLF
jgi:hypothetical protein